MKTVARALLLMRKRRRRVEHAFLAWRELLRALPGTTEDPEFADLYAAEARLYSWVARQDEGFLGYLREKYGEPVPEWEPQEC